MTCIEILEQALAMHKRDEAILCLLCLRMLASLIETTQTPQPYSSLEDIVDCYAHKVIAILDQQIVGVGTSIAELQQTVAAHYPQRVPLIFEVPTHEEFECLL